MPKRTDIKKIIGQIHDEVVSKYYGCGLTIPDALAGLKVLDLGSGSGRDCYILSKLVGQQGSVIGVDMTDEQLAVANRHVDYHTEKFGYEKPNVQFLKGNIDHLENLNIADQSLDLIVSNCVINLAENKQGILNQAFRMLKEGGEMYFSDVYASRRVPANLQKDPVLLGECLGGALYWNDFLDMAKKAGFNDPRMVEGRVLGIENADIEAKTQGITFYSITYRLMKISNLEHACEDYGQAVKYNGTITDMGSPNVFTLDDHHVFEAGRIYPVCGNSYRMLNETRYREHFTFYGDFETHFGLFEGCGQEPAMAEASSDSSEAASCC